MEGPDDNAPNNINVSMKSFMRTYSSFREMMEGMP